MDSRPATPRWIRAVGFVCVAVLLLPQIGATPRSRADDGGCRDYSGGFTSVLVPPPACTSPVGLCTHGLLGGDLPGTYDFTFATLEPAGDPNDPTKWVYTGNSVVTTAKGTIYTNDTGVIYLNGDVVVPFVTTAQFAAGTLRYKNASGVFVAPGELDMATGEAVGAYSATVCHSQN